MGKLGKLNIVISAVNKTQAVFKSVSSGLNNIRKQTAKALKVFAGMTTAITGVGVALGLLVKRNTEAIDRIQKVSDKLGINVELLQKLRFAAAQTGIAQETLDMAMQRFIRRVGEAQKGTGEAQGALAELGIQLKNTDGSFRSTEDVLFDVADGIQNAKDSSTQLRLAFKFFDSEGAALVNTLKNGSAGLKEFFNEAQKLGILIDSQTARSAAKFTDETTKLTKQIDTIQKLFTLAFVPALTDATTGITNFFSTIAQKEGGIKKFTDDFAISLIEGFAKSLIAIDEFVSGFTKFFGGIGNIIKGIQIQFFKLGSVFQRITHEMTFGLSGSLEKAQELGDKALELQKELAAPPKTNTFLTFSIKALNDLRDTIGTTIPAVTEGMNQGENAVTTFANKLAIFASQVKEPLKAVELKFKSTGEMIGDTIVSSMKKFEDTLVNGLMSGKFAFKEFADFVVSELARIAIKKFIIEKISGGFTSFFDNLGGREKGGTVSSGRPYIVGEKGAELFVPSRTGTIVPNNQLGMAGGGVPVNITYQIQSFDSRDTLQAITENAPAISGIIEQQFNRRGKRGFTAS